MGRAVTLSYLFSPSENFDIADPAARPALVDDFVVPGFVNIRRSFRMTANSELIGRDEINDLEAILSVSNTDLDAAAHGVGANFDTVFTWDYERTRPRSASSTRRRRRRSGTSPPTSTGRFPSTRKRSR